MSQHESNTENLSQTDTSLQDKTKSCPLKHTSHPQTQTTDNKQKPINDIHIILPSDTDYEWWIHNHAYMVHQAQIIDKHTYMKNQTFTSLF